MNHFDNLAAIPAAESQRHLSADHQIPCEKRREEELATLAPEHRKSIGVDRS